MHLVFLVLLLPLARALGVEIIEHKDQTLVPGIHLEQVNEILYDTYIPLFYEIPLPSWTPADLSVPNYLSSSYFQSCTNDNFYDSWGTFQCPVSFHMKEVIQRMSREFPMFTKYSKSNYSYGGFKEDISCSKLQQHFRKTSALSKEQWNLYLNNIHECKPAKVFFENVTSLSVNSTIYGTMLKNFINVYSSKTYYSNHERMAAFTNAYVIFQTAQLVEYSLMKSKWEEAVYTCKSGAFPTQLIPETKLQSSLQNIQRFLSSTGKGDKLSIEDVSEMTDYINLPLTSCTLVERSSLIVSIQIPTRRQSTSQENIYMVKSIPFLRKLYSSDSTETFEICEFKESLGDLQRLRLVSGNKVDYSPASCDSDYPLCQLQGSIENECMSNILSNNTEYVTEECPMTCRTINKTSDLPYFRQVSSDTWIILEERTNQDVFVNCDSKPVKMISGLRDAGTLQVTLPCDCQLLHRGRSLNSSRPCGQSLIVKEITPHFFNKVLNLQSTTNEPSTEEPKNNETEYNDAFIVEKTGNNNYLSLPIVLSIIAGLLSCVAIAIGFLVLKKVQSIDYLVKLRIGGNLIGMDL